MNPTTAAILSILPLLVGGVFTAFKGLLEDKEKFSKRSIRLLAISTHRIAESLTRAMKSEIRRDRFDEITIEDPPSSLLDDVASLIAKHTKLSYRLSRRRDILNICRGVLFLGIGAGIVGLVATQLFSGYEVSIAWGCIITVIVEVAAILIQYAITRRSEDDEEIL